MLVVTLGVLDEELYRYRLCGIALRALESREGLAVGSGVRDLAGIWSFANNRNPTQSQLGVLSHWEQCWVAHRRGKGCRTRASVTLGEVSMAPELLLCSARVCTRLLASSIPLERMLQVALCLLFSVLCP